MKKITIIMLALLPVLAACGKKADLSRPDDKPRLTYPEGSEPDDSRND